MLYIFTKKDYDKENVEEKSRLQSVSERAARETGAGSGLSRSITKTDSEWL